MTTKKSWFYMPNHPAWLIIRQLVVMIPLVLLLALGYSNGWSSSDWKTLIVPLASLGVFDFLKKAITKERG